MNPNERTIFRDCEGAIIPSGETITIPKGSQVVITHRLGGNFTVNWDYGLVRISGENADALGEETAVKTGKKKQTSSQEEPPKDKMIWEQLKTVFDPEIPVNIVDLGLVYSMEVKKKSPQEHHVEVKMTLTAPGCGMGPFIAEDAQNRLLELSGVDDASVEIVWDPPWHQDMISEEGKMQLGLI